MSVTDKSELVDFYFYKATVVKVVDGDTVDLDVDMGFKIRQEMRIRLAGVDAPEVRGPEREFGKEIKRRVINVFGPGTSVVLHTQKDKTGKYGRYIGDIWHLAHDGKTIGEESLSEQVKKWVSELSADYQTEESSTTKSS